MPLELVHTCPGARSRDEAEEMFWKDLSSHNGSRRRDPREFAEIVRITEDRCLTKGGGNCGTFRVHYKVAKNLPRGTP